MNKKHLVVARYEYVSTLNQTRTLLAEGSITGTNSDSLVRAAKKAIDMTGYRTRRETIEGSNGDTTEEIILYPYHLGRGYTLRIFDIKEKTR